MVYSGESIFNIFGKRQLAITNQIPVSRERTRVSVNFGCDGKNHATCIIKEWVNENNEVEYAEHLGAELICPCTGRCEGKKTLGGFIITEEERK